MNLKPLSNTCWPIKRMLNSLSCCLKCQGLCFWIEVGILDSQLESWIIYQKIYPESVDIERVVLLTLERFWGQAHLDH